MSPEESTHTNRHTDRHTITKVFSCFSPEERVNSAGQGSVHLILKGIDASCVFPYLYVEANSRVFFAVEGTGSRKA